MSAVQIHTNLLLDQSDDNCSLMLRGNKCKRKKIRNKQIKKERKNKKNSSSKMSVTCNVLKSHQQ